METISFALGRQYTFGITSCGALLARQTFTLTHKMKMFYTRLKCARCAFNSYTNSVQFNRTEIVCNVRCNIFFFVPSHLFLLFRPAILSLSLHPFAWLYHLTGRNEYIHTAM